MQLNGISAIRNTVFKSTGNNHCVEAYTASITQVKTLLK